MRYIKLKKKKSRIYFYFGKVELGYAYREIDGFYVFIFEKHTGCWSDYTLREIAEILTDLTKEWSNQIKNEL